MRTFNAFITLKGLVLNEYDFKKKKTKNVKRCKCRPFQVNLF